MKKIKLKKKAAKISRSYFDPAAVLLFLFVLLLPTQLGRHFFFPFSYLSGVRIDYLAPTVYLTDIIVFLILIVNLKTVFSFFTKKAVLVVLAFLFLSVVISQSVFISIYRYIRIVEALIVFAVFYKKSVSEKLVLTGLSLMGGIELMLAVFQLINKHSLQSLFYFLGERSFSLSTPGIAKVSLQGLEFIRPYATFSHPNSMAGFYLLAYVFILVNNKFDRFVILRSLFFIISSLLIFFSFSKLTIGVFLLINLVYFFRKNFLNCKVCFLAKLVVLFLLGLIFLQGQTDPLTISKRIDLAKNSLLIIFNHPVFGVGLGNYLLAQKSFPIKYPFFFLQPVHNIFLLFLSETGLLTGGFIFVLILRLIRRFLWQEKFFYLFAVIIITGFFDHYWLTLQQNLLLIPVVFGYSLYLNHEN